MQTFDEERKEVLESILDALAIPEPDPDRAAVCHLLLRHLIHMPGPAASPAR